MSGTLKRKFSEIDEDRCYLSSSPSSISSSSCLEWDSDGGSFNSDTLDSRPNNLHSLKVHFPTSSILKKTKKVKKGAVHFDQVMVYYFPRCQGFTSVPSHGGCTLGMMQRHCSCRTYTLAQFDLEQKQLHWEKMKNKLKEVKLEALRQRLTRTGTWEMEEASRLTIDDISDADLDLGGMDKCEGPSLQPYSSRRRYAILKAAGVKKIDKEEKRQLHAIRLSREDCGCDCQGFCEPETCSCSLAGIKCQMDHSSFPCNCTKDSCGNTEGRVEFNSGRVHTHYIHTIMKLELEKRLQKEGTTDEPGGAIFSSAHDEDDNDDTISMCPAFHFSTELTVTGESSCSSDISDSCASCTGLMQSETLESEGHLQPRSLPSDALHDGLSHILSFSDLDNEDSCCSSSSSSDDDQHRTSQCQHSQTSMGSRSCAAIDTVACNGASLAAESSHVDNRLFSVSEMLDENANQGILPFHTGFIPNSVYPTVDHATGLMDLSLSSSADLELFDGLPSFQHGAVCSTLKDYSSLDNLVQLQFPGLSHGSDVGTCMLESLIGLSDSIPEPLSTFTDHQLLEETMKSSVTESLKV